MRRFKITTVHGDKLVYNATDLRAALQTHHILCGTDVVKAKEIKA